MLPKLVQNLVRRDVGYRAPPEFRTQQLHEPVQLFKRRCSQSLPGFLLDKVFCNVSETIASAHARLYPRLSLGEVRIDRMRDLLARSIACRARFRQTDLGIGAERQLPFHTIDAIFQPPKLTAVWVDLKV